MEIQVAEQRIFLLKDKITPEEAKKHAWDNKMSAFDTMSKITSFFSRPKDKDFELIYDEHRYQPFWHVVAKSKYVYDRTANYQVPVTGNEVKSVTFHEKDYAAVGGKFPLLLVEHCNEENEEEVLVDGVTNTNTPELKKYLSQESELVTGALEALVPEKSIMVPPVARVSAIMRETLAKMIKGINADKIIEESVEVTCVDLYYHPIYAFQFKWLSKSKEAIVEIDGLTGEIKAGARIFREYMGKVLNKDFLFDLGADATGLIIPGGNIAVKVAKKYLDNKNKQ